MRPVKKRKAIRLLATTVAVSAVAIAASPSLGQYSPPEKCDPPGQPGTVCPSNPADANKAAISLNTTRSKVNKAGKVRITFKVDTRWYSNDNAHNVVLNLKFPKGTVISSNRRAKRTSTTLRVNLGELSRVGLWKTTMVTVNTSSAKSFRINATASASNAKTVRASVVVPRRR